MAVTQNTYTGDGTTVLFSFTFPYLETTDIKVSLNGTLTTAYTLANATTIQFNTAPANGAAIRIYRQTDDSALAATFYPGSAIRSQDLNENFTQNLYVTQESSNSAASATATANSALTASAAATSTSNTALSQSATALTNSATAVSTANTASSNATTALSQSSAAVSTANSSQATATSAAADAASALSAATTASSNASTALSQSNTALSNSSTALSQSNTALSQSASAVSTANTANSNAAAALNAVAASVQYQLVANVAAIPASPADGDAVEVANSTGIESFTPLANKPAGFVGDTGLSVRMQYSSSGSTWNWLNYFANDSDTRYLKKSGGTLTGALTLNADPTTNLQAATKQYVDTVANAGGLPLTGGTMTGQILGDNSTSPTTPGYAFDGDANTGIYTTGADELALATGGSARLTIDAAGNVAVPGTLSQGGNNVLTTSSLSTSTSSTSTTTAATSSAVKSAYDLANAALPKAGGAMTGDLTLNAQSDLRFADADSSNWVAFQGPATVSSNVTWTLPSADGTANQVLSTNGSGTLSWATAAAGGASVTTSDTAPSTPADGDLWYDSVGGRLYVYYQDPNGSQWVDAAPQGGGSSTPTKIEVGNTKAEVTDTGSNGTFAVTTEGSERLRVDSSGRLGIGVTTVGDKLHCDGTLRLGDSTWYHTFGAGTGNTEMVFTANAGQGNATTAANIVFRSSTSGGAITERARIDGSGRLLVGTSSARSNVFSGGGAVTPTVQIQNNTNSWDNGLSILNYSGSQYGSSLALGMSASNTAGTNALVSTGQLCGKLHYLANDGTNFYPIAEISGWTDGTTGTGDVPGRLVFSTTADGAASPTERARISSAGTFRVFGSEGSGVRIIDANAASATNTLISGNAGGTSTTAEGTNVFVVRTNGNVLNTNNSYAGISDAKLKENIVDASSQWDDLKALHVRNYNFKEETGQQTHTQIGLIAQEVELICPGLVSESSDRDEDGNDLGTVTKSVNYSVLYMKAVKALQEAMERIESLEAANTDLAARITALEAN